MDSQDREKLLGNLSSSRSALLGALEGVTPEMAGMTPAEGKWSVLQCVEHLAAAEEVLYALLASSQAASVPAEPDKAREAMISARAVDRSRPRQAPAAAIPSERYATLSEAVRAFIAARERTITFVTNFPDDLRGRVVLHPVAGQINGYEAVLIIAAHPLRHKAQIEEIKAALARS